MLFSHSFRCRNFFFNHFSFRAQNNQNEKLGFYLNGKRAHYVVSGDGMKSNRIKERILCEMREKRIHIKRLRKGRALGEC